MNRTSLIVGLIAGILLIPRLSNAQYSANFQTNIISGVTSNWSDNFYYNIGGIGDVLLIEGGGVLVNGGGELGPGNGNSNNFALVTDNGSVWSNSLLYAGNSGARNSLVISNGGQVINSGFCIVGNGVLPTIGSNTVLVTGTGSVLSNGQDLTIGYYFAANRVVVENGGQLINHNASLGGGTVTSSNNSAWVRGPGSLWINHGQVTFNGVGSSLVISNGGQVTDSFGYLGYYFGSSNTSALVTGSGSVWSNQQDLYVGNFGSSNTLVISHGGLVNSFNCFVGYSLSSNNSILVTDPGSVWSNRNLTTFIFGSPNSLVISNGGQAITPSGAEFDRARIVATGTGSIWNSGTLLLASANSLVISNGAQIINTEAHVGHSGSSNTVRVTDGALWQNNALYLGYSGSSNSIVVAAGSVSATSLVVGLASANCDNLLQVDSGSVVVTNATHDAVLEVRRGRLVLNGGTIQTDILVMTNTCASLVHNGGALIAGSVILDPNAFRIMSVTRQGNDILVSWLTGPGQTNTLQATAGDGSGGYSTNGFTDIFVVTNNTTAGTATNYLDTGGATNVPSRYYRARLVP
ncbi:MAG TPA: hypothetical protein VNL17_03895 [Verrucomicrobiae bacterium]|nr:hypothetical protein [Verrucomicrobiae bacterium]